MLSLILSSQINIESRELWLITVLAVTAITSDVFRTCDFQEKNIIIEYFLKDNVKHVLTNATITMNVDTRKQFFLQPETEALV